MSRNRWIKTDYDWVMTVAPGRQVDGFFLDPDGQILYWPAKRGPGYILSENQAETVLSDLQNDSALFGFPGAILFGLTLALIGFATVPAFIEQAFPPLAAELARLFSPRGLNWWFFLSFSVVFIWVASRLIAAISHQQQQSKIKSVLMGATRIYDPMPKPIRHWSMAGSGGSFSDIYPGLIVTVLVCGGFGITPWAVGAKTGDAIMCTLVALVLAGWVAWVLWLRFLCPPMGPRKVHWRYGPPKIEAEYRREAEDFVGEELTSPGSEAEAKEADFAAAAPKQKPKPEPKRNWLNRWVPNRIVAGLYAIPIAMIGVWFYTSFIEGEAMTKEALRSHWVQAVNDDGKSAAKDFLVIKWGDLIRVGFGKSSSTFSTYLTDRLEALAPVIGRRIQIQQNKNWAPNIMISEVEGPWPEDSGRSGYHWATWNYENFQYQNMTIDINMDLVFDHLPDGRDKLTAELGYRAKYYSMHALGVPWYYHTEQDAFRDRQDNLVRSPKILAAIYYDPRIALGEGKAEALAIGQLIAEEMAEADSFATWVERNHLHPGHWAYYDKDFKKAAELFAPNFQQLTDPVALWRMGVMLQHGSGVAQNYEEALRWYRRSAAYGFSLAQTNIGLFYLKGLGVTKDPKSALNWFRLAAEQGEMIAASSLCSLYRSGKGIGKDFSAAFRWCKFAAMAGKATAQKNLALLYRDGQGVQPDRHQSLRWLKRAAHGNNAPAQYLLAKKLFKADGVERDLSEARMWLERATQKGHKAAEKALARLNANHPD